MTSSTSTLRRTALAALALGTVLGTSACGAGQISQTANQVAAVDGGSATAGDISVNDLQVIVPEDGGQARVGFVASYSGSGLGDEVSLESVEIDGQRADVESEEPIGRGCSLVVSAKSEEREIPGAEDVCIKQGRVSFAGGDDLTLGHSVPATVTFSNGDVVETFAGVVVEFEPAGEFVRENDSAEPAGH